MKGSQGAGKVDESLDRTHAIGALPAATATLCQAAQSPAGRDPSPSCLPDCRLNPRCGPAAAAADEPEAKPKAPARAGKGGKKGKGRR